MALRNTAIDIGEDVLTQGYGRIDILNVVDLQNPPPIAEFITSGEKTVSESIDIIGTAKFE